MQYKRYKDPFFVRSYTKKIIQYGNYIDTYEYSKPIFYGFESKAKEKNYSFENKKTNFSLSRSRQNIYRLSKANEKGLCLFLTLTFKKQIIEEKKGNRQFSLFVKRFEYFFNQKLKYVCVPERHKKGGIHYHILIFDFPLNLRKNLKENLVKIWQKGFLNLKNIKNIKNVSAYLSKYLQKDFKENNFHRAFFSSRNLLRPVEIKTDNIDKFFDFGSIKLLLEREKLVGFSQKIIIKNYKNG